ASNLKQIGLGFLQYAQDYDEMMPHDSAVIGPTGNSLGIFDANSPACSPAPACLSPFYSGAPVNEHWPFRVQPYIKSTQLFQCPSGMYFASSVPDSQRVGYWANGAMLLSVTGGVPGPRHVGSVEQPSRTVLLFDMIE